MKYRVAEKFKSLQGEGVYAGTPMAFIRFVGCSVGKKICQHCDTDFDNTLEWRGGGEFEISELIEWSQPYTHICLTGGEPLDQDLVPFLERALVGGRMVHIETSGTKLPHPAVLSEGVDTEGLWVCVSPKPGFLEKMIYMADEVKVIVPGLGEINETVKRNLRDGIRLVAAGGKPDQQKLEAIEEAIDLLRWPTLEDALHWAQMGKTVFLQPRNGKFDVDKNNLLYVTDLLRDHPSLRLSVQMHKILKVQ